MLIIFVCYFMEYGMLKENNLKLIQIEQNILH